MKKKKLKRRYEELKAQIADMRRDIRVLVIDEGPFEEREHVIVRWKIQFSIQDTLLKDVPYGGRYGGIIGITNCPARK